MSSSVMKDYLMSVVIESSFYFLLESLEGALMIGLKSDNKSEDEKLGVKKWKNMIVDQMKPVLTKSFVLILFKVSYKVLRTDCIIGEN